VHALHKNIDTKYRSRSSIWHLIRISRPAHTHSEWEPTRRAAAIPRWPHREAGETAIPAARMATYPLCPWAWARCPAEQVLTAVAVAAGQVGMPVELRASSSVEHTTIGIREGSVPPALPPSNASSYGDGAPPRPVPQVASTFLFIFQTSFAYVFINGSFFV